MIVAAVLTGRARGAPGPPHHLVAHRGAAHEGVGAGVDQRTRGEDRGKDHDARVGGRRRVEIVVFDRMGSDSVHQAADRRRGGPTCSDQWNLLGTDHLEVADEGAGRFRGTRLGSARAHGQMVEKERAERFEILRRQRIGVYGPGVFHERACQGHLASVERCTRGAPARAPVGALS